MFLKKETYLNSFVYFFFVYLSSLPKDVFMIGNYLVYAKFKKNL